MTMDEKIARINALAHKAKAEGLTDEEKEEQAQLRRDQRPIEDGAAHSKISIRRRS